MIPFSKNLNNTHFLSKISNRNKLKKDSKQIILRLKIMLKGSFLFF